MATTKIKIEYDSIKKDALEFFTQKCGVDLSQLLQEKVDELYEKYVPSETKEFIQHQTGVEDSQLPVQETPVARRRRSRSQENTVAENETAATMIQELS